MVAVSRGSNRNSKDEYEVDYDKNITQLYEAITSCDWEVAIDAVTKYPREAKTWVVRKYEDSDEIMWRFLPIHSACARQPPASLISALLKAYPEGAKSVDDQGMYPLHYACGNQASREVIRSLLVAHPQAAKIPDPRGMLPIHYLACWGPSSVSIIDMVLVAHRDVRNAKDVDDNTALDLARDADYPEKEAVITALKRWFDKSKVDNDSQYSIPVLVKSTSGESASSRTESPSTVGRLRQEVARLKQEQKKRDEEIEHKMGQSVTSLKSQTYDLERKVRATSSALDEAHKSIKSLENSLSKKERDCAQKDGLIEELNERIYHLEMERDELRQTLTDVSGKTETYRRKAENMNDRIGSLSASLASMMEQQADLMKTIKDRELEASEEASSRRKKLESIIELEDRIIHAKKYDKAGTIAEAFEKQAKEMDAIAAVIAAIRK
jgi:Ankyrin repeat